MTGLSTSHGGHMKRALFLLGTLSILIMPFAVVSSADGPAAAVPTFTKDVAPILYNSCVNCHRPGDIAPMSLVSYQDVRPWARSIKLKVVDREMPPWGASPLHGKFKDDRSLSDEQIATIATWVDGGAPKGNEADL